jgi:TP901 family phage tail tape measure protein
MADMQAISIAINGTNNLSGPVGAAVGSLNHLESAAGKIGGAFVSLAATAAKAAVAVGAISFGAAAAGMASSIKVAADFESQLSAIAAVSSKAEVAAVGGMKAIGDAALQLGKDTSFSATEAAAGMEEMVKAGVSLTDVMGGGAKAALDLAAAGALSVAEAATVASNAMNAFGLAGKDLPHIADALAGASVASATDVHQLGFALAAVGAVAHTIGFSFDDTTTAISLFAQAGLKGSDSGTSLKTMLLNLSPSTKTAKEEMQKLGIITADGSNQFFDAAGNVKSMAEVAGVLQHATANLTKEQKINALQTIFGTDAIRAASILSEQGAAGITKMAEAQQAAGGAAAIANERLNNLRGALEKLGGTWEVIRIKIGAPFLPILTKAVNSLTDALNKAEPAISAFAERAARGVEVLITRATAAAPRFIAMGSAALAFGQNLIPLARSYLPMLGTAFERVKALFGGAGDSIGGGISNAIGTLRGALEPLIPVAEAVGQAFVTNLITQFRFLTDTVLPPLVSIVQQTAGFFLSTLSPAIQQTGNVLRGIFGETLDWLATTVWPPLLNVLGQTAQFFTARILPVLPQVAGALRTVLGESVQWVADVAWPALLTAAGVVVTFLTGTIVPLLPRLARDIRTVLGGAIEWVANTGWPALVSAGEAVATWITGTAIPAITQLVDWLGPKISEAVMWVTDTGWPMLVSAGEAVSAWITGTAIPALTQLWDWLGPKLQEAINWITTTGWPAIVSAGETVSNWITGTAIPAVTDLVAWLGPKIQEATTWITETGWPALVTAGEAVWKALQEVAKWLGDVWAELEKQKVWDDLNTLWETAHTMVRQLIDDALGGDQGLGAQLAHTAGNANEAVGMFKEFVAIAQGVLDFFNGLAKALNDINEFSKSFTDKSLFERIFGRKFGEGAGEGTLIGPGGSWIDTNALPGLRTIPPAGTGQTQNQGQRTSAPTGAIDNSSRESFVRTAYPYMLQAAGGDKNLAEMMLAAAISENGDVGRGGGFIGNNFFGIKGTGTAGSFNAATWEQEGGQRVNQNATFAAYNTPVEGFQAFMQFLNDNPRYAGALQQYQQSGDAEALFQNINRAGYATDTNWGSTIANIRRNQVAPVTSSLPTVSTVNMSSSTPGATASKPLYVLPVEGMGPAQLHWGSAQGAGGTDIFAAAGTPIRSIGAGTVTSAGYEPMGGWNVMVRGADGREYYYAHMQDAPNVSAGQSVAAGDVLGEVGDTGNAKGTGAHLHLGIGEDIIAGTGPQGGTGSNFNAVGFLNDVRGGEYTAPVDALNGALAEMPPAAGSAATSVDALGASYTGVQTPMAATTETVIATGEAIATLPGAMTAATDSAVVAGEGITAANQTITASFDLMAAGALTSVTNMGTGILTTVQDTSGNTIATITDMAGQVTSQSATLANGVSLNMADMGVKSTTSVNEMAGTITTVMTDAAGNAVTTITNMQGQVVGQFTQMQTQAGSAVSQLANVSREQFGAVSTAANSARTSLDSVGKVKIPAPDVGSVITAMHKIEDAADDAREAVSKVTGKGGDKGGDPDKKDNPFAKRASGGWTQGLTLVGERGPEFISPQRPMYVSNAGDTAAMLGGGDTYNFYGVQPESVFSEAERRKRKQELMYRIRG